MTRIARPAPCAADDSSPPFIDALVHDLRHRLEVARLEGRPQCSEEREEELVRNFRRALIQAWRLSTGDEVGPA
jgi:hypothetical protein